jgi:hypothetical protein
VNKLFLDTRTRLELTALLASLALLAGCPGEETENNATNNSTANNTSETTSNNTTPADMGFDQGSTTEDMGNGEEADMFELENHPVKSVAVLEEVEPCPGTTCWRSTSIGFFTKEISYSPQGTGSPPPEVMSNQDLEAIADLVRTDPFLQNIKDEFNCPDADPMATRWQIHADVVEAGSQTEYEIDVTGCITQTDDPTEEIRNQVMMMGVKYFPEEM